MDLRSPYGNTYSGLPGGASEGGAAGSEPVRVMPTPASFDKISSASQPFRRFVKEKSTPRTARLRQLLKLFSGLRLMAWGVFGIAAFAFGVLISTPLLMPLITFGGCFACGWSEWENYTMTAVGMSFTPGIIALISAVIAFACQRARRTVQNLLPRQEDNELRGLEELLRSSP